MSQLPLSIHGNEHLNALKVWNYLGVVGACGNQGTAGEAILNDLRERWRLAWRDAASSAYVYLSLGHTLGCIPVYIPLLH